mgnify:CR=1 FL=1
MKNNLLTILVFLLNTTAFAGVPLPHYIHANGYGPVKIGMTPQQASELLGVPLLRYNDVEHEGCYYLYPNGDFDSTGYMVQDEKIVRIDVDDKTIKTLSGLSVGSKEEEIQTKFKSKVRIRENPYGRGSHYVYVNVYGDNLLLFETRAQKITETADGQFVFEDYRISDFRIGEPSAVSLTEGCM